MKQTELEILKTAVIICGSLIGLIVLASLIFLVRFLHQKRRDRLARQNAPLESILTSKIPSPQPKIPVDRQLPDWCKPIRPITARQVKSDPIKPKKEKPTKDSSVTSLARWQRRYQPYRYVQSHTVKARRKFPGTVKTQWRPERYYPGRYDEVKKKWIPGRHVKAKCIGAKWKPERFIRKVVEHSYYEHCTFWTKSLPKANPPSSSDSDCSIEIKEQ